MVFKEFLKRFIVFFIFIIMAIALYKIANSGYDINEHRFNLISQRCSLNYKWFHHIQNADGSFSDDFKTEKGEFKEKSSFKAHLQALHTLRDLYLCTRNRDIKQDIREARDYSSEYVEKQKLGRGEKAWYVLAYTKLNKSGFSLSTAEKNRVENYVDDFVEEGVVRSEKEDKVFVGDGKALYALMNYYDLNEKDEVLEYTKKVFENYYVKVGDDFLNENYRDKLAWHLMYLEKVYGREPTFEWFSYVDKITHKILRERRAQGVCHKRGCVYSINECEYDYLLGVLSVFDIMEMKEPEFSLLIKNYFIKAGDRMLDFQVFPREAYKAGEATYLDKRNPDYIGGFCKNPECTEVDIKSSWFAVENMLRLRKHGFP